LVIYTQFQKHQMAIIIPLCDKLYSYNKRPSLLINIVKQQETPRRLKELIQTNHLQL